MPPGGQSGRRYRSQVLKSSGFRESGLRALGRNDCTTACHMSMMQHNPGEGSGSPVAAASGGAQRGGTGACAGCGQSGVSVGAEQPDDPEPQLSGRSSLSPHLDPAMDVVLRYDVLSSRAVKVGGSGRGRWGEPAAAVACLVTSSDTADATQRALAAGCCAAFPG